VTMNASYGSSDAAVSACGAAAERYAHDLGWNVLVGEGRPAVALSVPLGHAGIDMACPLSHRVNQFLDVDRLGPVIGCPDGRQVHLVVCRHPPGQPPEPQLDRRVAHVGVGSLVYLPPTRDPSFPEVPLVWLREPSRRGVLPDCEELFELVRLAIGEDRRGLREGG